MKYIFPEKLTNKEKKYVRTRFKTVYPDAISDVVTVVRNNGKYLLIDNENDINYRFNQRRSKVLNDSEVGFKCTCDEKDLLNTYCYENNISISEVCRTAINEKLGTNIFE